MNEINELVFQVYEELLNSDYKLNEKKTLSYILRKIFRYIVSGYIFQLRTNKIKMNLMNEFIPSNNKHKKSVVVYTACYGKYDSIKNPIYINPEYDYYIFTDQELPEGSIWKKYIIKDYETDMADNIVKSRLSKLKPHLFFSEYEYSVYIDSNIRITCGIDEIIDKMIDENKCIAMHNHQVRDCIYDEAKAIFASGKAKFTDIRKQVNHYKKDGFPEKYGLFENNIIIRKHNKRECILVMDKWWEEFCRFETRRDQLSFMYALWKKGYTKDFIMSLGNNSRRNPYFIVGGHK